MTKRFLFAAALLASSSALAPASAQDASFGCKVLLCVAATSPSWSGIPYCVPPMTQLFRSLAKGGSWPTCPEGNAGGLGYEPYMPCPEGTVAFGQLTAAIPGSSGNDNQSNGQAATYGQTPDGSQCVRTQDLSLNRINCSGTLSGNNSDGQTCTQQFPPATARQTRSEPNYVDITSGNGASRFYFSLRNY